MKEKRTPISRTSDPREDNICRIIGGKKYDTKTAQFLGKSIEGTFRTVPYAPREDGVTYASLYRKKTGEYFLLMQDVEPPHYNNRGRVIKQDVIPLD